MATIGKLVKDGKMRIGDYIYYIPDQKIYITVSKKTGCQSVRLTTEAYTVWRIWSIVNNGSVCITTENAVNIDNVMLSGIDAYKYGVSELNHICKILYSKESIAAIARSFAVCDFVCKPQHIVRGSKQIYCIDNTEKECLSDIKGPIVATSNVLNVNYEEEIDNYWVASQSIMIENSITKYGLIYAGKNGQDAVPLFQSGKAGFNYRYGVRPLVHLSSIIQIDESFGDGSFAKNAWKIANIS